MSAVASDDIFSEAGRAAYLRRQKLVAEFGQAMGLERNMAAILQDAAEKAAVGMEVCCSTVTEYRPERDDGIVRAATGWKTDIVDRMTIPATTDTPFGYSVKTREPLHIGDVRSDPRFVVSDLFAEHGIASLLTVPIMRSPDEPFGTLEVDSEEPRDFPPDGTLFLLAFSHLIGASIARRAAEVGEAAARLAAIVVAERDTMLLELQHRMNNNLSLLAGMLQLEARRADNSGAREALEKAVGHIHAIAEANRQLDARRLVGTVDLGTYLPTLCANILKPDGVHCHVVSEAAVAIAPDRAIPIGLIVNEAVTNACKHAFSGRGGDIRIVVGDGESGGGQPGWASVAVEDDGIGMTRDEPGPGSGREIIDALARQLRGRIERRSSPGEGTRVTVRFPIAG